MTAPAPVGEWAEEEATEPTPPQLEFPTLDRWVREWLAPTWRRRPATSRIWCPEWWRHPEALWRLEGLWRSWEHYRLPEHAALGTSVWARDHLDHHLPILLDPDGPFTGCTETDGHRPRSVPLAPLAPPPGLLG